MRKQHISRLQELIGKLSDQVAIAQRSFMTSEEIQMEEMLKQEAKAKEEAIKW